MPAGNTYEAIATETLTTSAASVTFSSISGAYTDLQLVVNNTLTVASARFIALQFNSDTGANYSATYLYGDGATAASGRGSNDNYARIGNGSGSTSNSAATVANIMNYSNTTTYKTTIGRSSSDTYAIVYLSLWRSTSAITSIKVICDTTGGTVFGTGSTFTLYGIKAA
jgi:hypothetical protein